MENQSFAMAGGEGPHSYAHNSSFQREGFLANKKLIEEAIAKYFDPMTHAESTNLIRIADFGCSTGPNTIIAMQTIIEAIQNQYKTHEHSPQIPEFLVFFNDQVSNDFNTLFKMLPPQRNYFASGTPGSFYNRLFPRQSLHFVHSSGSLQWLSKVPEDITDRSSVAFNKGRIHYINAPKEVGDAYAAQYKVDLENFLHSRAQELVGNGLMVLQLATVPDVILESEVHPGKAYELLGSSLMEMAKLGIIAEEKVDSFNMPIFFSPMKFVEEILEGNEYFSLERTEALKFENFYTFPNVHTYVSFFRAVKQDLIEKHFGGDISDELFDRFSKIKTSTKWLYFLFSLSASYNSRYIICQNNIHFIICFILSYIKC